MPVRETGNHGARGEVGSYGHHVRRIDTGPRDRLWNGDVQNLAIVLRDLQSPGRR